MIRMRNAAVLLLILALPVALPALAEGGYIEDFKKDLEGSTGKLLQLAEATPAESYGWRPAEGVRSVGEVFVHVASANYFFASRFGVEMPEEAGRDAEKTVTDKAEIIAMLKKSVEAAYQAAEMAREMDLDEEVDFFGGKRSRRGILMILAGHSHEHLGQAIAYARSNGITPPWSAGGN